MTDTLQVHEITIERASYAQGTTGGVTRTYDTENRSGSPSKVKGRAIRLKETEKIDHGVRGDFVGWKFLVPDVDPKVTLQDRVTFEYIAGDSSTSRTVKITVASFVRSNESQVLYKFAGQEDSSE